MGCVQLRVAEPVEACVTVMAKAGSETDADPELAEITMFE